MLFNSIDFLIFFPIVLIIYFILPSKVRYLWLLVTSYYFYMCWNPVYIVLIVTSTVLTYLCALLLEKYKIEDCSLISKRISTGKTIFIIGLGINLIILFYYKYTNFIIQSVNEILIKLSMKPISPRDILLPVGISFYTFQALGYMIDVYKGEIKAEKNLLKYALFVSFFPQLVAGPIERSKNLLKQIEEEGRHKLWNYERVTKGLILMLWGYFIKVVIADRIAVVADHIFSEYEQYGLIGLSIGVVCFGIQIYCDFYGYSTIAMGSAKVLDFHLMDNFNTPYFSMSITEFWKRWHISLSTWFKDYVYIPLGGSYVKKWKQYRNLMITFLVSGLWHGANWTYVFWGGIHGVYQIIERELEPIIEKLNKRCTTKVNSFGYKITKVFITFILVNFAWIFFRAESLQHALDYIIRMISVRDWWSLFDQSIYTYGLDVQEWHIVLLSGLVFLVVEVMKYHRGLTIADFLQKQWIIFRWAVIMYFIITCVIFGYYGPGFDSAQFIYFQF